MHVVAVLVVSAGIFSSVTIVGSAAAQEQEQQDNSITAQITGGNIAKRELKVGNVTASDVNNETLTLSDIKGANITEAEIIGADITKQVQNSTTEELATSS